MRRLLPAPAVDLDDDALLRAYAVGRLPRSGRHLRVNAVASADGAGSLAGGTRGLGPAADRRLLGRLRGLADVVLVGAGTARSEGYRPLRTARLAVVSDRLDLPAALLDAEPSTIVVTSAAADVTRLAGRADVLVAGAGPVDLTAALDTLADRGLGRILCEGGPTLLGGLLAAGLVDELCLTLAPVLLAGGSGRIAAGPPSARAGLRLRHVLTEDGALFLRYGTGVG